MQVTRKSLMSGVTRTLDLPVTEEQFKAWSEGELIQRAFPNLNNDQREFILTGIVQEEWDKLCKEED